jgi:prepilin-type N-terminal cleavage/methylation domain-containing protein
MRKGFTLVELIIAIGIMALLLTIGVYGVRSTLEATREAGTRQTIAGVNSLLSERVKSIGANVYPAQWYHNGVYGAHNGSAPGLWIAPARTWVGSSESYQPTTVADTTIPEDYTLWQSDLLRNTVIIFNDLSRFPNGRAALAKMTTAKVTVDVNGAPLTALIPTDGWGRPLLFAPGIGITVDGVTVYQQSTSVTYAVPFGGKGGTYPYVFSAGKEGNPSVMANVIR